MPCATDDLQTPDLLRPTRKQDFQRTYGYLQPHSYPRNNSLYMVIHPIIAVRIMTHPFTPSISFSPSSPPLPYPDTHLTPLTSFHRRSPLLLHGTADLSPLALPLIFLLSPAYSHSAAHHSPYLKASEETRTGYNGHTMDRPIKGEGKRLFLFVPHTATSEGGTFSSYPLLRIDAYLKETRAW